MSSYQTGGGVAAGTEPVVEASYLAVPMHSAARAYRLTLNKIRQAAILCLIVHTLLSTLHKQQ
jgi:hypothetical protein